MKQSEAQEIAEALNWWDRLRATRIEGQKDRGYYTDKYFGYNMRMHKHLTTKEIVNIWRQKDLK